ncbi:MAG TPA: O-antigen ligase family protein, partial [Pyrinomonadaceae bacterium]
FFGASRKILLTLAAIALPIVLIGVYFQQQSRQVGYFDSKDESTRDRETFYRKGFDLWTKSPRNFLLGVGMDSTKRYVNEWNLFDNHGAPMGHFHSTPLQLVVERGLPALLLWILITGIYARTLWRGLRIQDSRFKIQDSESNIQHFESADKNPEFKIRSTNPNNWQSRGIMLGCFGGLVGFFTSGLVHYNLGDAEVAMIFFMLMGISISLVIQESKLRNES